LQAHFLRKTGVHFSGKRSGTIGAEDFDDRLRQRADCRKT